MTCEDVPGPAELARYEAALAAAADPLRLMDGATDLFRDMTALAIDGDHVAKAGAAVATGDACLRLCSVPALSRLAAGHKVRLLRIMTNWAWSREPALAAVMVAAMEAERRAWSDDVDP